MLTLYDVLNPPSGPLPLSAATLSSYGITAGVAGVDLVLSIKRRNFRKAYSYSVRPLQESPHVARELYEKAEGLLAQDRREEALHFYGLVVHEHKDSVYLPQALFKIAKIHFLTDDDTLAILESQLLVNRYPLPDLYDKAEKMLADLYARQGDFAGKPGPSGCHGLRRPAVLPRGHRPVPLRGPRAVGRGGSREIARPAGSLARSGGALSGFAPRRGISPAAGRAAGRRRLSVRAWVLCLLLASAGLAGAQEASPPAEATDKVAYALMQDTLLQAERWMLEMFVQPGKDVPVVVLQELERLDAAVQASYFRDLAQRSGMLLFLTREEVRLRAGAPSDPAEIAERLLRESKEDRRRDAAGGALPRRCSGLRWARRRCPSPAPTAAGMRPSTWTTVIWPSTPPGKAALYKAWSKLLAERQLRAPRGSERWASRSRCRPWPDCARAEAANFAYFSVNTRTPVQSAGGGSFWKPRQSS